MIGSGSIGKQALWLVTGTLRPGDAGLRSGDSVNEARRGVQYGISRSQMERQQWICATRPYSRMELKMIDDA